MERRRNRRKRIHLPCTLEFFSGISGYGHTYSLSFDGALARCDGLTVPGRPSPKPGDMAVFGFGFRSGGKMETMKVMCRVTHMEGNSFGLQLFSAQLNKRQQTLLLELLGS
jgi:hypothetical protein